MCMPMVLREREASECMCEYACMFAYAFNHMSRELATYDQQNRELIAAIESGYLATLRSLASAIDAKDPSTIDQVFAAVLSNF